MVTNNSKLPRSFTWLNITQFLGALNDNVFKLLVVFLLLNLLGDQQRSVIIAATGIAFVLPFLLFSHAAGVLADRISKRSIIVFAKFLEAALMLLGCIAVFWKNPYALYGMIFLMCAQSALFGPSKYGIVPELVSTDKLSKANGMLVGFTYLAIIIGTFIPSFLLLNFFSSNFLSLSFFCVFVAGVGILTSLRIKKTPPAGSTKRFSPLFVVEIFRTLRDVSRDHYLFFAIIGSAYFLYLAAFMQQNIILYGQDNLGLSWIESGYLFPVAALGIGIGALLAGKVSGRNIEFGIVPFGALGLSACCLALGSNSYNLNTVLSVIFLAGVSCGLFIVPLDAFIQYRSPAKRRGEILASTNFMSFLGIALASGTVVFFDGIVGLTPSQGFLVLGSLTVVLAVLTLVVLPDFFVRFIIMVITKTIYRIRAVGLENVPVEGGALLVSNHVTWVDSLLIGATQQRRIRFVMGREIFENRWLKPLFKLMKVIPVSPKDPPRQIIASLKEARLALDDGYLVCIFAEGAMTRNGNMHGFKPGLERIVRGTGCPIIPVFIGGAWGSILSYYHGKPFSAFPKSLPYPVSLIFGESMPASSSTWEVRQAVMELSGKVFDLRKRRDHTLPNLFVRTARKYWFRSCISDTTDKRLSFGRTLAASIALSGEIEKIAGDEEKVGVILPASVGGALANIAISLLGRVPVNLNFTASSSSVKSAIRQCSIKTVISSNAFAEKLENFKMPEGTVFLEDVIARITCGSKCFAFLKALLAPARMLAQYRNPGTDDLATIIFSSGSTGEPKGVMLSHHNIISNIESFQMLIHFGLRDRMCAILPFFHSFGYTCTLWCPLVTGCSAFYHPNPLDGSKVAEIVRENRLTVLIATPTFLLSYVRRAKPEDFDSLRIVIVGAEKLRKRVADAFEEKFGIRPLEGYGTTELSPVAGLNIPDVEIDRVRQAGTKEGSVGHPIPGVAVKIVDPESGIVLPEGEQGLLMVKGPNVMLGYLNNPEKTSEVLRDGWYNTGDIAKIDSDGFVFLLDRMSRYSKIGGEMVPHLAVEEKFIEALGTISPVVVVTSAPDEKKGEQLVVLHTDEAGESRELHSIIRESDLPNLWKPRKENYFKIDSMPTLGSGKLDQKRLREIARDLVENRPGIIQRVIDRIKEAL